MEGSGCGTIVSIVMGLAFIGGVVGMACSRSSMGNANEKTSAPVSLNIASVGKQEVTQKAIEEKSSAQISSMASESGGDPVPTETQAQVYAAVLSQEVQQAIVAELAARNGVYLPDTELREVANQEMDQQIELMRQQMIQKKQLKEGATMADVEKEFKRETGQDLKATRENKLNEIMSNPEAKASFAQITLTRKLQDKLGQSLKLTDDDLKIARDVYQVNRVAFTAGQKELAEKLVASVKGGKDFDTAVTDLGLKSAKVPLSRGLALINEKMASLRNVKVGETSQVIETVSGFDVYKVISVDAKPPKDFAKEKPQIQQFIAQQAGQYRLFDALAAFEKSGDVKWSSKGFENLYKVNKLPAGGKPTDESRLKLEATAKEPLAANDTMGKKAGAFARYLAIEKLWSKYTAEEKKTNADVRIAVYQGVLEVNEDPSLRVELAKALGEKKDATAGEMLLTAATNNSLLGQRGQKVFSDVNATLDTLKKDGLVKPDIEKQILDAQEKWKASKKQADADKASAEAAKKKQEEELKKEEAEAKKKAEEEAKNNPAPKPSESDSKKPTAPAAPSAKDLGAGG